MSANGTRERLTYADYEWLKEKHRLLTERLEVALGKLAVMPTEKQLKAVLAENAELRRMNSVLLRRNTILKRRLDEAKRQ